MRRRAPEVALTSSGECIFCGRKGDGVTFAIFDPRFQPFGTACTDCEETQPPGAMVFEAVCRKRGLDPVEQENAILSVGRELLPPFAIAVLDGDRRYNPKYDRWLQTQLKEMTS